MPALLIRSRPDSVAAAAEIRRELELRARLYAIRVREGLLDIDAAARHIERLTEALRLVELHDELLALARDMVRDPIRFAITPALHRRAQTLVAKASIDPLRTKVGI